MLTVSPPAEWWTLPRTQRLPQVPSVLAYGGINFFSTSTTIKGTKGSVNDFSSWGD